MKRLNLNNTGIFFILLFSLYSCSYNSRSNVFNLETRYYLYSADDEFSRKQFRWQLEERAVLRENTPHIRVYINQKNQIMLYEINKFEVPDYDYLVERRRFTNIIEEYLFYGMDAILMFYSGIRTYFLQEKVARPGELGFLHYDEQNRLAEEHVYNARGVYIKRIRYKYKTGNEPVERTLDEIISERFFKSRLIMSIRRRVTLYAGKKVIAVKFFQLDEQY